MRDFINTIRAELLKLKNSPVVYITFVAFALAPLMGSFFMIIMQHPEFIAKSGAFKTKATLLSVQANWPSFLSILCQAIGIGGIIIFGFVASYIFGREYTDHTAKDLLALPVSRSMILYAKFCVYLFWCFALTLSNLLLGLLMGWILQLPGWGTLMFLQKIYEYGFTALLTIALGTPIAFFALAGRGYLAPLGYVVLTLIFAQVIGAAGLGYYFPWSIPGLYSGAAGEYKEQIDALSYILVFLTFISGIALTLIFWEYSDQAK